MHPINQAPADSRTLRRFAIQFGVLVLVLLALLLWRGILSTRAIAIGAGVVAVCVGIGQVWPAWLRPVHAGSVALSVWMGKYVGGVGLVVFFFLVITPLGLVLRLFRHDALALRKKEGATTYWRPARQPGPLNRMF